MQQCQGTTPTAHRASQTLPFRPPGDGPFRLAVVAHATPQNVLRRAQMPQPEYKPLAAFLVRRGFAVLVPERSGHGATGGPYLEDQGGCDEGNYARSGRAAGAWGAVALAASEPREIAAIIAFAPGRGGHANDRENEVCAPHTLIAAASAFGKAARVAVTWLVAANDTYFSPELSRSLADAFRAAGGKVQFFVLPPSGSEGHWMAETETGVKLAERALARALKLESAKASRKP